MNCAKIWGLSDQSGRLQSKNASSGPFCPPPCKVGLNYWKVCKLLTKPLIHKQKHTYTHHNEFGLKKKGIGNIQSSQESKEYRRG